MILTYLLLRGAAAGDIFLYVLYRVSTGLLGAQDRKVTWVLVRKDQRVNLAFRVHLEDLDHQVHLQRLEGT